MMERVIEAQISKILDLDWMREKNGKIIRLCPQTE
jgi:hypothetical protein